ncbi:hypothetical protein G6F22_016255 [Rhizopus arrhizus]|nr:hypothetical protein G6F22_016255 [Rhizopus arrhizus]
MADGMMGAALLARYETALRPEALRWDGWVDGQLGKVRDGLALVEKHAASLEGRLDIGVITIGCALGYLDFRFPDLNWRDGHPATAAWYEAFSQRPSMQACSWPAAPAMRRRPKRPTPPPPRPVPTMATATPPTARKPRQKRPKHPPTPMKA